MLRYRTLLFDLKFNDSNKTIENRELNIISQYIKNCKFCPLKLKDKKSGSTNTLDPIGIIVGVTDGKAVVNLDPNKIDLDKNMRVYVELLDSDNIKFSIGECDINEN